MCECASIHCNSNYSPLVCSPDPVEEVLSFYANKRLKSTNSGDENGKLLTYDDIESTVREIAAEWDDSKNRQGRERTKRSEDSEGGEEEGGSDSGSGSDYRFTQAKRDDTDDNDDAFLGPNWTFHTTVRPARAK